jgi:hypothetical protein
MVLMTASFIWFMVTFFGDYILLSSKNDVIFSGKKKRKRDVNVEPTT